MVISRTPFRVSFFGGGTDYPAWFRQRGGAVLSTTIDKYCYITCRRLPPFFEHKSRIVYSKVEYVKTNADIEHPAVRAILDYLKMAEGVEIHHDGDLPARTGLGSSSSFAVGLLHASYALKNTMTDKMRLAREAIHIEQEVLKENVGWQDQVSAAFGGLNRIDFARSGAVDVTPITISRSRLESLQSHLMLYFTGFSRIASLIAKEQIERIPDNQSELARLQEMVPEAAGLLCSNGSLDEFGRLLHEAWTLKRRLSSKVSSPEIDEIYEQARASGALGGKLLGAGGGGFMLLFARPQDQPKIRRSLEKLTMVPFRFETEGSRIIVYQPESQID